jgi:hypothetical protein
MLAAGLGATTPPKTTKAASTTSGGGGKLGNVSFDDATAPPEIETAPTPEALKTEVEETDAL